MSQKTHCPVPVVPPGLLLQCPPPFCQCGRPEQCLGSAAPEPPAHYMSCSQNLERERERETDSKGVKLTTRRTSPLFSMIYTLILTFVRVIVADVFDGVPHHLLVVHVGPRCDFSAEQHHAGLTHRFCK